MVRAASSRDMVAARFPDAAAAAASRASDAFTPVVLAASVASHTLTISRWRCWLMRACFCILLAAASWERVVEGTTSGCGEGVLAAGSGELRPEVLGDGSLDRG